jgi:hypothetical protein
MQTRRVQFRETMLLCRDPIQRWGCEVRVVIKLSYGLTDTSRRTRYEFVIWAETRIAGRTADIEQVATVDRPAGIEAAAEIKSSLADGKADVQGHGASCVRCSYVTVHPIFEPRPDSG